MQTQTLSTNFRETTQNTETLYDRISAVGIKTTREAVKNAYKYLVVFGHSKVCSDHGSVNKPEIVSSSLKLPISNDLLAGLAKIQSWSENTVSAGTSGCYECFEGFVNVCLTGEAAVRVSSVREIDSYFHSILDMFVVQSHLIDCGLCERSAKGRPGWKLIDTTLEALFYRWYLLTNYRDQILDYMAECAIICDAVVLDDASRVGFSGPNFLSKLAYGSISVDGVRYGIKCNDIRMIKCDIAWIVHPAARGISNAIAEGAVKKNSKDLKESLEAVKLIYNLSAYAAFSQIRQVFAYNKYGLTPDTSEDGLPVHVDDIYSKSSKIVSEHKCTFDDRTDMCLFKFFNTHTLTSEHNSTAAFSKKMQPHIDKLISVMNGCISHLVQGLSNDTIYKPEYCAKFAKFLHLKFVLAFSLEQYIFGGLNAWGMQRRTYFSKWEIRDGKHILKDNEAMIALLEELWSIRKRKQEAFLREYKKLMETIPSKILGAIENEKSRRYMARKQSIEISPQGFSFSVSEPKKDSMHIIFHEKELSEDKEDNHQYSSQYNWRKGWQYFTD